MSWHDEALIITADHDIASTIIVGRVMEHASKVGDPVEGLHFVVPTSLSHHHVNAFVKILAKFEPTVVRYETPPRMPGGPNDPAVIYVHARGTWARLDDVTGPVVVADKPPSTVWCGLVVDRGGGQIVVSVDRDTDVYPRKGLYVEIREATR